MCVAAKLVYTLQIVNGDRWQKINTWHLST